MDRARFIAETLAWINRRLAPGVLIEVDTPLFEDGLIDSIKVLQLIAWTEKAIGRTIPDDDIRMDHFHSVGRIAEKFLSGVAGDEGPAVSGRRARTEGRAAERDDVAA